MQKAQKSYAIAGDLFKSLFFLLYITYNNRVRQVGANNDRGEAMPINRRKLTLVIILLLGLICVALGLLWAKDAGKQPQDVTDADPVKDTIIAGTEPRAYDVVVVGTDPEGVAAAISAARNDLKVLLVDSKDREILGGLITLGWLNTLDLNYSPDTTTSRGIYNYLNKGIFQEWYDQLEGTSVDVNNAADVFMRMVDAEPNIDLQLKAKSIEPVITEANGSKTVTGLRIVNAIGENQLVDAKVVIDATQNADMAIAAGVPHTRGREDVGDPDAKMAVTLVFKLSGLTEEIWQSFGKRDDGTGIDKMSAWGFKDAKFYESTNPERVSIRGLNIGRLNDNTLLINAMHIYEVNPFDPASVQEALEIGRKEAPIIAKYLSDTFPELKDLKFAGTAPELYVRETYHIRGEYRLTMADLMNNRDFWDAIAYGSYDVDIQKTSPADNGTIVMSPLQYGVPFRSLVPLEVDGILVVGRSASFDTLPHGSARVIPLGMATGQAAGAAAKLAIEEKITVRELSQSKTLIEQLRKRLTEQGMDLEYVKTEAPAYTKHSAFKGLLAAVSMGAAAGGYDNDRWDLDGASNAMRFAKHMAQVKQMHAPLFLGDPYAAIADITDSDKLPLTLEQAAYTILISAGQEAQKETAADQLLELGWVTESTYAYIENKSELKNGEAYMLLRDIAEYYAGAVYE